MSQVFLAQGRRLSLAASAALFLAACGGGGGGGSTPPPPPPPPAGGTTMLSGKATFDLVPHNLSNGLDYNATVAAPVRGAVVQLVAPNGNVLATAETDDNGDYAFSIASSTNVRVRVRAELVRTGTPSWNFAVIDNTSSGALYVLDSDPFTTSGDTQVVNLHAASGWTGSAYTETRAAGPFAILDAVYKSYNAVLGVAPQTVFPSLEINWSVNNRPVDGKLEAGEISTSFYRRNSGQSEIYLLGAANQDTDEYDDHIVIHEWGHYLEDRLGRSDSVGGSHGEGDRLDLRVAFSEGFGYAFAGMVTDDPNSRDSGGFDQGNGFNINVEDNLVVRPGWYSEGSVQSILYDLYDADADGVDAVELGLAPIYEILTGVFADGVPVTSIFAFIDALKTARPDLETEIDAIVGGQSITTAGLDAYGSTETNDAGSADVLPVYTLLPTDGTPVQVCSLGGPPFGTYNKLSNRRFLRVTVANDGRYRITVSGAPGSDPDVVLFQGDFIALAQVVGNDTLDRDLTAGDYVVEVYEAGNVFVDDGASPAGRTCIDVTMSQI